MWDLLREHIERSVANGAAPELKLGEVMGVNLAGGFAEVLLLMEDFMVRVNFQVASEEVGEGFYAVPRLNALVIVAVPERSYDVAFIVAGSSFDVFRFRAGGWELVIDRDSIRFNGGANGGLVKVSELVGRLNELENAVNKLVGWVASHVHPVPDGVSGIATPPADGFPVVQVTVQEQLENPSVLH